jgi:exopolyphosphatase/guanosine-5'-triphosphate,3'-diphosphate pyrophosphatase
MGEIRPRWEWRSFGDRFPSAEARLATLEPSGVQQSDELYLLNAEGDNVKVRDALMDIKVLKQVGVRGLEQWIPVMKQSFPLPAAEASAVLGALRLPVPATLPPGYTLEGFLEAFTGPGRAVRAVRVQKRRVRYTIRGCMAEFSDVIADGHPTRTIAVEAEDADAVLAAVRELGLQDHLNTSYPRGLAALIDGVPPRYAVIDVGTNSVKFHVGERQPGGGWRTVIDRADVTRLGEGLGSEGRIAPAAIERTAAAIRGMVEEARAAGARAIAAVGTAGLRMAPNRDEALAAFEAASGIAVEVISGEEESRLAYLATVAGLGTGTGPVVVFDTGGGSSQFTFGHGARIDERFSVDVGAVRYTERFGLDRAVSAEVLQQALAAISQDLSRLDGRAEPAALVGMGGAITNITAVRHGLATYDPAKVQGTVLERAEIDRQVELYRSRDADTRRAIVGLQPKRAEVILAGACIVRTVMEKLGQSSLTVSDRGLRHGVLEERYGS